MSQQETINLSLWDKEPLMRLLAKRLTPVSLGIGFYCAYRCLYAYLLTYISADSLKI